jgi:cytoskeletal protein CcmA (bactofilin family)
MDGSELGEHTKTTVGYGSHLNVEGPLTLDGTLDIVGLCSLRDDVSGKLASNGKLIISNSSREHFPFLGRLTVPRDTQNVMIGVGVQFKSPDNFLNYGLIIVERNSSLVFADGVADSFFVDGKLTQGFWRVQEGASCVLKDNMGQSEIDVIGEDVKVTIEGAGTPGRIADLPSPTHSLFVEGELELRGATLDMNGQTLWNRKKVTGSGATIIGEVQSIRGDVQGVIKLSGDIRIEGNLTNGLPKKAGPEPFGYRNGKLLLRWANDISDYRWQLETSVGLESWEPIGAFSIPQSEGPDESLFELVVGGAAGSSPERYYQLRILPVEP